MIVDKINAYLSSEGLSVPEWLSKSIAEGMAHSFKRQFGESEERTPGLRLSSIGKCRRQQAYGLLGVESNGKKIDSRSKMVFFMGDVTENAIVHLAILAGCRLTSIGMQQLQIEIDGVSGHPDGLIWDGGINLLEVKSMSSYAFARFEQNDIDESYLYQINAYLHALGLNKCAVVALNKDAGVMGERILEKDEAIVEDIKKRIVTLRAATLENLPERPYAPNDKGYYPWQCVFCNFWGTCLPNAKKVVVGKAYKLKTTEMERVTADELKAMVGNDAGYYALRMEEIKAESAYTRLYEKLLAVKKQMAFRTAY